MPEREIILEYTRIGNSLRVVAVDTETGTEVVFQAPHGAMEVDIHRIAANKMKYVLGRKEKPR